MFELTKIEFEDWRSRIVTANPSARMGLRRPPYAFTEQGVAMLSSVLRSERAVEVNIWIMRAFARVRELMLTHSDTARKLHELEKTVGRLDREIRAVFDATATLTRQAVRRRREPAPDGAVRGGAGTPRDVSAPLRRRPGPPDASARRKPTSRCLSVLTSRMRRGESGVSILGIPPRIPTDPGSAP